MSPPIDPKDELRHAQERVTRLAAKTTAAYESIGAARAALESALAENRKLSAELAIAQGELRQLKDPTP